MAGRLRDDNPPPHVPILGANIGELWLDNIGLPERDFTTEDRTSCRVEGLPVSPFDRPRPKTMGDSSGASGPLGSLLGFYTFQSRIPCSALGLVLRAPAERRGGTRGPRGKRRREDDGTNRPRDQGTKGLRDQGTKGPREDNRLNEGPRPRRQPRERIRRPLAGRGKTSWVGGAPLLVHVVGLRTCWVKYANTPPSRVVSCGNYSSPRVPR